MSTVKTIALEALEHNPAQLLGRPLPKPTDKNFAAWKEEFCDSIENEGLLNVFSVRYDPTIEKYFVIDGNHRLLAIKMNIEEGRQGTIDKYSQGIPSQILDVSDVKSFMLQLAGNHNVTQQRPASFASSLHRAIGMDPANHTVPFLAKECSMSEANVEKYLKLNLLPDKAKEALDAGTLSIGNAVQLTTLPMESTSTEDLEDEWLDKAKTTEIEPFTAEVAKEIKAQRQARSGSKKSAEFVPTARVLKKEQLLQKLEQANFAFENEPSDENRIRLEVMNEIFQMDPVSIEKAKADFETASKKAAENKAKRAEARKIKDAEAAKELLKGMGMEVVDTTMGN